MGAEKIALGLDEVGGKAFRAKGVEICEGRRETHYGDTVSRESGNRFSQSHTMLVQEIGDFLVQQKARQARVTRIGTTDLFEPRGTYDAAAAPYFCGFAEVKTIRFFDGRLCEQGHSLRIGDKESAEQGAFQIGRAEGRMMGRKIGIEFF